jgi:hypothetical protein
MVQTATNALVYFQWRAHGTNLTDSGNLAGTQAATLTISGVTAKDNGTYSVVVSNVAGFAVSTGALLTVTSSPPIIVSQPVPQRLCRALRRFSPSTQLETDLCLTCGQANGSTLTDDARVSGSRSSSLSLGDISPTDARAYSVIVSNSLGWDQP